MSGDGTVTSSPDGITCTGGTTGCSADFTAGAPVVLTATPASGWRFYGWGSPCTGTGTCTVTMTEAKIVTLGFVRITPPLVTVSISGSGSVTSLPAGINCANTSGSTTCSSAFASGVSVQLTATPASGYQFYGWGGACTGAAACSVSVTETKTVLAYFGQFGISMLISGSGAVTSSPSGLNCTNTTTSCFAPFALNTQVTLTPIAATGYRFSGWGGVCSGTGACVVTITESKYVTASFVVIQPPGIIVTIYGSGTVTSAPTGINCSTTGAAGCSAAFATGTSVQLTATPATGYHFYGWSPACGTTPTCTVSVTEGKTVLAAFAQDQPATLTVHTSGNGSVTSSPAGISCSNTATTGCAATFTTNAQVVMTETPASGYRFYGWSGPCTGTDATCTLSMNESKSLTAVFVQVVSPSVTVQISGGGTVTSSPSGIVCSNTSTSGCSSPFAANAQVVLTEAPASGYRFYGWGGACSGTDTTCTVSVTEAKHVIAGFVPVQPPGLTVKTSGAGTVNSSPAGINCSGGTTDCSAVFGAGVVVTLTATPASGWRFYGWGGACAGTDPCVLTATDQKTVTAAFTQTSGLAVRISGSGTVTSTPAGINCTATTTLECSTSFAPGTQVQLTATASTGYRFYGWGGACTGTGTCAVTMSSAAQTVTATFVVSTRTSAQAQASVVPFGVFDTPTDGATGLGGAVSVTGWALDDIGVDRVEIWRNCIEAIDRSRGACASPAPGAPANSVFIDRAVFIEGARPDVETLNDTMPQAYRAGWGYMLLTNALPNQTLGTLQGGQGTYTLSAYAVDVEGNYTLLGQKTVTVSNDAATVPFGTIDTPAQGATIPESTSPFNNADAYPNFGWAATQSGKCIDTTNTNSYRVYVDGVSQTLLTGINWFAGLSRADIAAGYPGLCNTGNALAVYYLNATQLGLTAGIHTIAWDVVDSDGAVAGIGSRFFNVASPASTLPAASSTVRGAAMQVGPTPVAVAQTVRAVRVRIGSDEQAFEDVTSDPQGRRFVQAPAVDRLTLDLGGAVDAGGQVVGTEIRTLPAGSTLDAAAGRFYWQPPVGFFGSFSLTFAAGGGQIEVQVTLTDRPAATAAPLQMTIDLPTENLSTTGPVVVAGWALDPDAVAGSGVDTIHVWAYRRDITDAPPQFMGVAALNVERPDVAQVFGGQFHGAGFQLVTPQLAPGTYDLVVYAWSHQTEQFEDARVVRVVVR